MGHGSGLVCLPTRSWWTVSRPAALSDAGGFAYAGLKRSASAGDYEGRGSREEEASKLMPRVHRVVSLLKRWSFGNHPSTVADCYLPYYLDYLDEFTFRFKHGKSKSCGKLIGSRDRQSIQGRKPTQSIVRHVSHKLEGLADSKEYNTNHLTWPRRPYSSSMSRLATSCAGARGKMFLLGAGPSMLPEASSNRVTRKSMKRCYGSPQRLRRARST